MIGIKKVEGEGGFRPLEGGRVPAYAQKLAILLDPLNVLRACAKLDVNVVDSVDVDYSDNVAGIRGGTGGVLVSRIEAVAQVVEGCPLEKPAVPNLTKHEEGSVEVEEG